MSSVLIPATAMAQTAFIEKVGINVVNDGIAYLLNILLGITSSLVFVSGLLLSLSVEITTDLSGVFEKIGALKEVWLVIRNISSIFIIFMLLYVSISTILGVGGNGIRELIGKIVIAGLLINFSLFFAKTAIDASNLISLQFYHALVPKSAQEASLTKSYAGGLSNVFMNSLKIPTIYKNSGVLKSTSVTASISIATFMGVIMMITAALSFFGASIMFIARTAILVFCMAMSPLYFVSMIFPNTKEESEKIMKLFKSQLIFMPTYLFMMYVAMRFISSPGFSSIFNPDKNGVSGGDGETMLITLAGTVIQYVIALVFINAPLVAAIAAGGTGAKWSSGMTDSLNGWLKKSPGALGSGAWKATGGWGASKLADKEAFKDFAGKSRFGQIALQATRGIAKNYNESLEKDTKKRVEFAESLGYNKKNTKADEEELKNLNRLRARYGNGQLPPNIVAELKQKHGNNIASLNDAFAVVKTNINKEKNSRKNDYIERLKSKTENASSLFTKLAANRKGAEKVGKGVSSDAAKLEVEILKNELNEEKDELKTITDEIKALDREIGKQGGIANASSNMINRLSDRKTRRDEKLDIILKMQENIDSYESKIETK